MSYDGDGPYFCPACGNQKMDITDAVRGERDEQMMVLRTTSRPGRKWSVIVTCPENHEIVIDGVFPPQEEDQ